MEDTQIRNYALLFGLILVVSTPVFGEEPPVEQWVARYDSPTIFDLPRDIAVDTVGNVYITGESGGDFATVKYDCNGNQLWVRDYNGPSDNYDYSNAIAIDSEGNVYVTGCVNGSNYGTIKYDTNGNQLWVSLYGGVSYALAIDNSGNVYVTGSSNGYATVKYDSNGNQLWVASYHRSNYDGPCAIVVDNSHNVYVTGFTYSTASYDYSTIKYDSSGNQLWVAHYNGPANGSDSPGKRNTRNIGRIRVLAVDNIGNVYVTGSSTGIGTNLDYATVKYDSDGNQLWVARYNGPGNDKDVANALVVDNSGNVYVTGHSTGNGTNYDYATVKYDSSGNQLWVARYTSQGNSWDIPYAIGVDSSGSVCVTGRSFCSEMGYECTTIKYDLNGNQLWIKKYNGPGNDYDTAYALAIDESGNVYVTGDSKGNGTSDDYATIKYSSNGDELWVARYNGAGTVDVSANVCFAVDVSRNVVVTGGLGSDFATVKYDCNGSQLWTAYFNAPENWEDDPKAIALDSSGNIYVTGDFVRSSSTTPDMATTASDSVTIKYDPNGSLLWVRYYYGGDAQALAVDKWNNAYVAGNSYNSGTFYDYRTIKYDPNGNQLWLAYYNGTANDWDSPSALCVDNSGNVYVTGQSPGIGTEGDCTTVKYDPNGNQLWVARYNGTGNNNDYVEAIVADDLGNIYITGYNYLITEYDYDYVTVKYDQNGNQLWVARYNGPGNSFDFARALTVDNLGNVYVTGYSTGITTGDDYATIKYDSYGNELWAARYSSSGDNDDPAIDIAIDSSGNVYVTGSSKGIGTGYGYATVKYDSNGNQLWLVRYNNPSDNGVYANDLAVDNLGNVWVTGWSEGNSTSDDFVTIKYTQHGYCISPFPGDYDGDCIVNFTDFAMLAEDWLESTYIEDLAELTEDWLECNFALEEDCW